MNFSTRVYPRGELTVRHQTELDPEDPYVMLTIQDSEDGCINLFLNRSQLMVLGAGVIKAMEDREAQNAAQQG